MIGTGSSLIWVLVLLLLRQATGMLQPTQHFCTQPPYLSASLGSTARLTCTLSSNLSKSMYWYQQKLGSPPSCTCTSDSDKQLRPGVPSRFSESKDASTNPALLHISELQPEDEANYYYQVYKSSAYQSEGEIHQDDNS
uniref:Ig-like domain-containing protein n=1 Tax=Sciurus vulgaris TaxID=55149 RepID=A0A8D2D541_SCIVU